MRNDFEPALFENRGVNSIPSDPSERYCWPPYLLRHRQLTLVYLDLNHWIALAKAATGHAAGTSYGLVLEDLRLARSDGRAIFPLSGTHYMEMLNIRHPRQRHDIAAIMEELSGFSTLLSRDLVFKYEIDAVLTERVGPAPEAPQPVPIVGYGCMWAFGRTGRFRIRGPKGDATETVRQQMGSKQFDAFIAEAELRLERSVLAGPTDDEVEDLRGYGWNPESIQQVAGGTRCRRASSGRPSGCQSGMASRTASRCCDRPRDAD